MFSNNQINSISFSPTSPTSSLKFNDSKKFATQRWNLILSLFYEKMPLKCHWKYLWPYDNSFTGREAIEFLLKELPKIIFGPEIQRANCTRLLQKFCDRGFIVNIRNPKDLEFTEKNVTIFRFNDSKIQNEFCKLNESTFSDSSTTFSPHPLIRRAVSNNEQYFSQSDYISNPRSATLTSMPSPPPSSFSKSPKRTIFSSFRNLKRSKLPKKDPVFNIPPPPSTPPPPICNPYHRKREMKQQLSPPLNKKYPRLSSIFI
uniref:DEP domain-containing protein n=1 Tax=Panagrolaimus superbus TaxID=310955 RepID=A0A914YP56_9BILA